MDILREAVGWTPIQRAWRFLVIHTRQSHWTRMDFQRTLWMTLPSKCVHLGEGWEPVHTEWFIFPKCHKWRNGTFGRQLGMSFKKQPSPKAECQGWSDPTCSLSSQAEEMRILGHCWPETVFIVSKIDPLSVHIKWTPSFVSAGPALFTQHSAFLTVSPLSGSPQNEAVELPICQAWKFGRHWFFPSWGLTLSTWEEFLRRDPCFSFAKTIFQTCLNTGSFRF